ncbi:tryptophan synthase subunit beta [Histidinibacterium lentulum]|uniref:Tryptophan synthase subunit beta n=1 Tax=Histidinibacterium lentulum TaxID=2480588 RepID=A0A3N2R9T7_9RHOB|nr:tryptophan synthase subunit beta [Histidinibacterium lentulum]ROU04224.1 tryptophan synthase subunit beta [Histidinibacterium lentulum]
MADEKARLDRQLEAIARSVPPSRRMIHSLLHGRLRRMRLPVAFALILGGMLSILPVLGLWMLPLGLLLLAVDVPCLRPVVSRVLIRIRRWMAVRRHRRTLER